MADGAEVETTDETERAPRWRRRLGSLLRWETMLVILLLVTIAYGASASPYFLEWTNLFFIGLNVGEIAIIALPLTLIIITGEIDLSVASMLGLTGRCMAELFDHGWPIWPAMIAAVLVGGVLGAFNGILVTRIGLPSLAVTIGTLTLYRGIAQGILPTDTISGFPQGLASIGVIPIPHTHISYSVLFFLVLAVVFGVVLHATPLGRAIFAIGANQEAAFYSGIRVRRIKFWLFVLSGLLSGFAGVLWTLRFASARYDSATGMELLVVTIVLLGGVSIFGGKGTIAGVALAAFVYAGLHSVLLLSSSFDDNDFLVVSGGLLIVSVLIQNVPAYARRMRDARRRWEAQRRSAALERAA